MKIGLAQVNPTVGDFKQQKKKIFEWIDRARKSDADLLIFPELTLTGYPPRDLLDFPHFVDENLRLLTDIAEHCRNIAVVVGFVSRNEAPSGKRFHNSAAFLSEGKVSFIYHKQLLPFYDVFEEERYFEPGKESLIFRFKGKTLALSICEDAWNIGDYLARPYPEHPLQNLVDKGLDYLINISASPFHLGKSKTRVKLFGDVAASLNATVLFCNQVGANDELIFDGCSFAIDRNRALLAVAPAFEESITYFGEKSDWPEEASAWHSKALVLGIRDYVKKCGGAKVVLGLSGGIDSSVVTVLATHAVGSENVAVVSLPTRYTSNASQEDASALAANLGISLRTVEIEPLFSNYLKTLAPLFSESLREITVENLQPRLRMTCLMAVSNQENALLLNTSNKSELATGYSTLYGDTSGAISPLGDLTKNEVFALARYINREEEIIPKRVLERPPTAELRENQTDEQSLPPYAVLDSLVQKSVEGLQDANELEAQGVEKRWVDLFFKLYNASEYKRRQTPPILRVSARAFGMGRRIPIAKKLQD